MITLRAPTCSSTMSWTSGAQCVAPGTIPCARSYTHGRIQRVKVALTHGQEAIIWNIHNFDITADTLRAATRAIKADLGNVGGPFPPSSGSPGGLQLLE